MYYMRLMELEVHVIIARTRVQYCLIFSRAGSPHNTTRPGPFNAYKSRATSFFSCSSKKKKKYN